MTSNTAAPVPTLTRIGSTRHRADYQVADNGAGIFIWPNGQAMRVATVTLAEEGDVQVRLIPQTKTGRDYKRHYGNWMPLQQLPGDMVGRILDAIGALAAPAADELDDEQPDREPTAEQERAWDAREDDARGHTLTAEEPVFTTTPEIEARMDRNAASWATSTGDPHAARFPVGATVRVYGGYTAEVVGYQDGRVVVTRPGGSTRRIAPAGLDLTAAPDPFAGTPLAADAPLGRVQFYDGSEDAPRCPCGNDVQDDGFRTITVAESVDGKIGVFIDPDGAWHALGRHVTCLADFCLRVWSEHDITRDATGVWAPVKFRLHHLAEADAGEPTPAVHPYFLDKARAVFAAAGGDPANADELAAWAERVRPTGDSRLGVIVTEAGRIVAETRHVPGGAGASYVVAVTEPADSDLVNREAGLAAGALTARHGQTVRVKFSQVCRGAATH